MYVLLFNTFEAFLPLRTFCPNSILDFNLMIYTCEQDRIHILCQERELSQNVLLCSVTEVVLIIFTIFSRLHNCTY